MTIQTVAKGRQWTVPSESRPGVLYIVVKNGKQLSCDCPGGIYRPEQMCKHQRAVNDKMHTENLAARGIPADRPNPAFGIALLTQKPVVP